MAQEPERPKGRWGATGALALGFPVAAWFFMGGFGLELGLFVVLAWLVVGSSRSALWGAAVGLLVLGMLALVFGGLPRSGVVGAQFGVDHLLAHRVVGAALAVAAFAGILELMGLRRGTRDSLIGGLLLRLGTSAKADPGPGGPDETPG